ncbi:MULTISPECIES: hypothetical protein [unclassified Polaribacter]|uniref:hypothetical protein n=1 Tax=unclassified Polaribacter TaxID=196858 RepID=UPI00090CBA37|nr:MULTISPECIES: hypothetical protein [unclassified Polaribacter]SHN00248.1 hypothetical protein SAMN05720268_1991 [Polaribacter sp. KT 15]
MIATKIIGLTSALTKSKKAKIGLLLLEIAIIAVAYKSNKQEKASLGTDESM